MRRRPGLAGGSLINQDRRYERDRRRKLHKTKQPPRQGSQPTKRPHERLIPLRNGEMRERDRSSRVREAASPGGSEPEAFASLAATS